MTLLIGQTLQGGKYSLEQELGRGGFGITFKATHHYLGQFVVIKTLNESLHLDPNFSHCLRQFQDEARRLAVCVHPNIVRISDFFLEAGLPYMVMDYVPGQTLQSLIAQGEPLSETMAISYIRQIGEALKVVHEKGLLHRDVKPENILRREGTDEVVLIDFGIAREFDSDVVQTHTSFVSDGYSPVEQYLKREKRTPALDVYSLAATLYALLTAKVPVPSILRNRQPLPEPRDLQPHISVAVNQAIMRGMAVEARYRPQTVEEWISLLANSPGESLSAVPTHTGLTVPVSVSSVAPPKPDVPAKVGIKGILLGTGVAIATGLVVTLGLSWNQPQSPQSPQSSPSPTIQPSLEKATSEPTEKPVVKSTPQNPIRRLFPKRTQTRKPVQPPSVPIKASPSPVPVETPPSPSPSPSSVPEKTPTPPQNSTPAPAPTPSPQPSPEVDTPPVANPSPASVVVPTIPDSQSQAEPDRHPKKDKSERRRERGLGSRDTRNDE